MFLISFFLKVTAMAGIFPVPLYGGEGMLTQRASVFNPSGGVDPVPLSEYALQVQSHIVMTIARENEVVFSSISDIQSALLERGLVAKVETDLQATHMYWMEFCRLVVHQLCVFGYVMLSVKLERIGKQKYIVPDVIPGSHYYIIAADTMERRTQARHGLHAPFLIQLRDERDQKRPKHIIYMDRPERTGRLTSRVARCYGLHLWYDELIASNRTADKVNCRPRAIVTKSVRTGIPTEHQYIDEVMDYRLANDTGMPYRGPRTQHGEERNLWRGIKEMEIEEMQYSTMQNRTLQEQLNMEASKREIGYSSLSTKAVDVNIESTELDNRLPMNTTAAAAPSAVYNPQIITALEHIIGQISKSMGIPERLRNSRNPSAEALAIQQQQMDRTTQPIRIMLNHCLELVSGLIYGEENKQQWVELSTRVPEYVFESIREDLTPKGKQKIISEIYDIDPSLIDATQVANAAAPTAAQRQSPGSTAEQRARDRVHKKGAKSKDTQAASKTKDSDTSSGKTEPEKEARDGTSKPGEKRKDKSPEGQSAKRRKTEGSKEEKTDGESSEDRNDRSSSKKKAATQSKNVSGRKAAKSKGKRGASDSEESGASDDSDSDTSSDTKTESDVSTSSSESDSEASGNEKPDRASGRKRRSRKRRNAKQAGRS